MAYIVMEYLAGESLAIGLVAPLETAGTVELRPAALSTARARLLTAPGICHAAFT
jgi:hypothetical protein